MGVVGLDRNYERLFDWIEENLDLENVEPKKTYVLIFLLETDEFGRLSYIDADDLTKRLETKGIIFRLLRARTIGSFILQNLREVWKLGRKQE